MNFDTTTIILTITSVLLLALGAAIYLNQPRDPANIAFAAFTLGLSGWTIVIIGFLETSVYANGLLWMKAAYAVAFFCGLTFWFFAEALQGKDVFRRGSLVIHGLLLVLYVAAIFTTDLIVRGWHYGPDGSKIVDLNVFGWWMYAAYFCSYFAVGNLLLFRIYRKSGGALRRQLRWLIAGVFVGGEVFGVFFNLLLPSPLFNEWHHIWAGPFLTAVFIVPFITYGIIKDRLLRVRIVAAETLVFAMILLSLFNLILAHSASDITIGVVIFLGMTVFGFFLISSVIDEVKRREEVQRLAAELEARNKRLRQLDDLKTTMVSIASHQLRGPIGGIRGYLSMFRDGDFGSLTDRQREIVALNLNVLSRMLNAVETFLDITKLESGKIMLKKERAALDEVVGAVVDEFRIPLRKKGLTLSYEAPSEHVLVMIDPEKTKHVIFNLIDNATKYTEKGGITIGIRVEGDKAFCDVGDTGMGIPAEDLPRLFGKFERGELVVDRGGSGLGLYVVKMLTEMQGGRVWVSSPGPGKGCRFTVSLPLSK